MEQATLAKMRADTAAVYVFNGILTPEAVRQQMLDRGELTQEEFDSLNIEPDVTPDVVANDTDPVDNSEKAVRKPDFMGRERRKVEASFQSDIEKALKASFAEFKKKILGKKPVKELPFMDDIINDEEMLENFRVRVVSAAQPYFRNGALEAAAYNASLGLGVNMDLVNQAVLDFTRTYTNEWWMELSKVTRDGLRKAIAAWQETGLGEQGLQDLVNSITPLFGEARARRIAVTETTRIFDEGNKLARQSAGIKYEEFQTSEDDLVCQLCGPLNGLYFGINEGPRPPIHVGCRCARISAANYNPVE
jgi:SPP1 gp7 family putative phage head morphogenesis protein